MLSGFPATVKKELFNKTALVVVSVCLLLAVLLFSLSRESIRGLTAEGGMVENLQAVIVLAGAVFAFLQLIRFRTLPWGAAVLAFIWMFLRELDFQRNFTPQSIESVRFYKSSANPLGLKILVLAILLPFVCAIFFLGSLAVRRFRSDFRAGRAWTYYLIWAGIMLLIGRSTEKLGLASTAIVEEVCELGFETFLFLVMVDCARHSIAHRKVNDQIERE